MPQFSTARSHDASSTRSSATSRAQNHPDNRGGWGIGNLGPIPEGLVTWRIAAPLLVLACLAVRKEDAA